MHKLNKNNCCSQSLYVILFLFVCFYIRTVSMWSSQTAVGQRDMTACFSVNFR